VPPTQGPVARPPVVGVGVGVGMFVRILKCQLHKVLELDHQACVCTWVCESLEHLPPP